MGLRFVSRRYTTHRCACIVNCVHRLDCQRQRAHTEHCLTSPPRTDLRAARMRFLAEAFDGTSTPGLADTATRAKLIDISLTMAEGEHLRGAPSDLLPRPALTPVTPHAHG